MSKLAIHPAGPTHIASITAIYGHAVENGTASFEREAPSVTEMERRYQSLAAEKFPFFVAISGGQVAGYAYAGPYRPRPAYRYSVEDSVYVHPDMKGRGIGRQLMNRLVEAGNQLGFRQMIAIISDGDHQNASVRLHEAVGFIQTGRIIGAGFKHGQWLDTIIMQLALNGGTETLPG